MIELVVAIVIMGIAMMTLPLMLTRVQKNSELVIQQEAILMARTNIGDILTFRWDENSEDINSNIAVLDTNGSNSYKRNPTTTPRRVGHVKADKRRKFFSVLTSATPSGIDDVNDNGTPDDIDDFDSKVTSLQNSNDSNSSLGYKLTDTNITTVVKYISDTPSSPFDFNQSTTPTNTTNIKMIEVNLQNSLMEGNITLRAFSCNIGANQLLRKTF